MTGDYRALICVTTCRRLAGLRSYLPHYAQLCVQDRRFSLLVALDGTEEDTIRFCAEWDVALVYADEREGVGLSKNRVLERFPAFDYYFFVEDDVELVDGSVFPAHVELSNASGIHHFSLFGGEVRGPVGESVVAGRRIVHGLFGGAHLTFYTAEGLARVGGWHPRFAEYRRWGHTEHSYRFPRVGLAPAPFNVVTELSDACIWHVPPPVTRVSGVPVDADQISSVEREVMGLELSHLPVQTLSAHHSNGIAPGSPELLVAALAGGERYPLVGRAERRRCRSSYQLWRFEKATSAHGRIEALLHTVVNWPANPALRHKLKSALVR